jgi:hypothetical protein
MRVAMESISKDSPMYDYVEQINNKEIRRPLEQKIVPVEVTPEDIFKQEFGRVQVDSGMG